MGPGPGPCAELKEESICVAVAASIVAAGFAVGRLASWWIVNISGESGCLAETGVCAIPNGAARLSTNKLFKQRDKKDEVASEELQGSCVDDGVTSIRIQCSFNGPLGFAHSWTVHRLRLRRFDECAPM